uniref:MULE transposase domain-containing protein n=1 Tax=Lactuca sativa TaxID=4236 RepID=A0A9R1VA52_LACSA|nr:hypothetical protein LSAT_V11C600316690 [Lactuca sativa]
MILEDLIYSAFSNHRVLNHAVSYLMDDTISAGDDHSHDQHEYAFDYADHDEDFRLADHDSIHNINFDIVDNSNLNLENENKFIDDEADDTIADDNIDLQKDQDPSLNKAVNEVFPMSSHRFCMWHITKKLSNKNKILLE